MSLSLLQFLFLKSAGVGLGIFIGALIGLSVRRRNGKTEGLLAGSIFLTSLLVGVLALVVMMAITYFGLQR